MKSTSRFCLCALILSVALGCSDESTEPSSTNTSPKDMSVQQSDMNPSVTQDMAKQASDASTTTPDLSMPRPDLSVTTSDMSAAVDMAPKVDASTPADMNSPKEDMMATPVDMSPVPDASTCSGDCTFPLPGCDLKDVKRGPGNNWSDSYSSGGKCYCETTFDHDIGKIMVDTPVGKRSVKEICDAIGPGPGRKKGDPIYNDVQCGNGPANNAGDEDWCPGRVDQNKAGCCTAGPKWDLSVVK